MPAHAAVPGVQRATARRLRREQTPAEARLWTVLKAHRLNGAHFRRQVPMGRYVVDFACHGARLVVEVDGEQHGFDDHRLKDAERDAWIASQGYRVLRFWNRQVLTDLVGVTDTIFAALEADGATR